MKILDSHVHFWNYDRSNPEFDWISEGMEAIQRSFMPEDYLAQVRSSEFVVRSEKNNSSNYSDKTSDYEPRTTSYELPTTNYQLIAIQVAQTWQESEFLLKLASKYDFIKGVVGWADINNYELKTTNYELLKGFRHIIQSKPHGFMTDDRFRYFISKLRNKNYTYDLLIKPHQLSEALELVQEFPNQKFVIDHLAKPDIRNQDIEQWKSHIQEFKHLPNVYCKLSGMVTEAYWHSWKQDDFKKALDTVFHTFGTSRLMYGSDWPVCLLAGDYQQVYGIVSNYISKLSTAQQQKIMAENAMSFYNIQK